MNPAVVHVFNWREQIFSKLGCIDRFNVWRKTKVLTATLKVTVSVAVAVSVAVTVEVEVIVSCWTATNLGRNSSIKHDLARLCFMLYLLPLSAPKFASYF